MKLTAEKLYNLIPSVYRIRDTEAGQPLKALIDILAEQGEIVEDDIAQLYANWFIETCDELVVPYIGDLLRVKRLHHIDGSIVSQRAYVANTIAYRRRKGTATMLQQLARDTTGWSSRVVEFFELLGTTQYYNHIRAHNKRTPDLRNVNTLELLNTAFDTVAHTADVRSIKLRRGFHNIMNIGIYLWRIQNYPLHKVDARSVDDPSEGRFTCNPLGIDTQLFNNPVPEKTIERLAREINVPGLLRRRPLHEELDNRRSDIANGNATKSEYFEGNPVIQIFIDDEDEPVKPEEIVICNLKVWRNPPSSMPYEKNDGTTVDMPVRVAVDPVSGRFKLPSDIEAERLLVSYSYGFSGDVGGGPYQRRESTDPLFERPVDWQAGVAKDITADNITLFNTISEAVDAWNEWSEDNPGSFGIISIMDNRTYHEDITGEHTVKIPEASRLLIVGANWIETDVPDAPGTMERIPGNIVPYRVRPHLLGKISVHGTAGNDSDLPGECIVNGLLVEGDVTVTAGNLGQLRIDHCTIVPDDNFSIMVEDENIRLRLTLHRSICEGIHLHSSVPSLLIDSSIVDRNNDEAISASDSRITIRASTIFGSVAGRELNAENSIFTGHVNIERRQTGCVRFSYLPVNSITPGRYRCQPDIALKEAIPGEEDTIIATTVPSFTSVTYGHYGYAQLRTITPEGIRTGAENGSEMGVFMMLQQPHRVANLKSSLDEYLRFGLQAGITFAT